MAKSTDKHSLRTEFLTVRQAVPSDARAAASQSIIPFIKQLVEKGSVVAGYMAIRGELDIMPAMQALAGGGQALCLPVTLNNSELVFRHFTPGDALDMGAYNIPIPPANAPVVIPEIMLVPMVAFDANRHRLGYGAGYYDRAIQKFRHKNNTLKVIGVAFACQQATQIPAENLDEKMDAIVTEAGIVLPKIN